MIVFPFIESCCEDNKFRIELYFCFLLFSDFNYHLQFFRFTFID